MNHPLINEKHRQWIEKVKEFARNEVKPLAKELDITEKFSSELTRRMGQLGLFGMYLPEVYGGSNTDYFSLVLAVEELAKVDSSQAATLASQNSLGIGPIYYFGSEEQKKQYLPGLCTGDRLWAFGLTEANAGSDSRGTQTEAKLINGNLHITGTKMFISNASSELSVGVTLQVITGIDPRGEKELSTILVDRSTPGYHTEKLQGKMMWRATDTARMRFENCIVPQKNILGEPGKGSKIMLQTLDSGRLTIAAMGLGLAEGAFELSMKYAKKREQFGKPIIKFQATSFKLADMATKIEAARNLLYHAVWLKDHDLPFGKESAMAKLYCSEIAREVADECVQIHGAYGLFNEYEAERFYRDQRLLQIGEGTSEILRVVIARHIGC
jgi:short/branched chain acyl-CoA dehydrogenase